MFGVRGWLKLSLHARLGEPSIDVVNALLGFQCWMLVDPSVDCRGRTRSGRYMDMEAQFSIQEYSGIGFASKAFGELGHQYSKLLIFCFLQCRTENFNRRVSLDYVDVLGIAEPFQISTKLLVLAGKTVDDALWILCGIWGLRRLPVESF